VKLTIDIDQAVAVIVNKVVEVPPAMITEIKKYFDLSIGFESADIDVYSAYNFSQKFTLSIDEVVYYNISLVPAAMFSNDTEIGLTVGYVLDFLRASMKADLKLPLGELLNIPALPSIPLNLDSADIFESRLDIGTDSVARNYAATNAELIMLVGVMPA